MLAVFTCGKGRVGEDERICGGVRFVEVVGRSKCGSTKILAFEDEDEDENQMGLTN